jgi:hypothetical protein
MIIRSVDAFKVSVPLDRPAKFATRLVSHRDFTIVRMETDEGTVGRGLTWWTHPAEVVRRLLAQHLVGKDPSEIEKLWLAMYREVYRERKGGSARCRRSTSPSGTSRRRVQGSRSTNCCTVREKGSPPTRAMDTTVKGKGRRNW